MLGRLRMTLADCEDAYLMLSETIFTPRRSKINLFAQTKDFLQADGKFDAKILERTIKTCISKVGDEDVLLKDPESSCKVYVSPRFQL
jgi:retron-type reverse transcriptase